MVRDEINMDEMMKNKTARIQHKRHTCLKNIRLYYKKLQRNTYAVPNLQITPKVC